MSDRMDELLGEFREFRGEVRSDLGNIKGHIGAVSKNADGVREDLAEHKDDIDAHGMKQVRRIFGSIATAITVVIAILEMWHAFRK